MNEMEKTQLTALLRGKSAPEDRFDRWREILRHRGELSPKELLRLWYGCFNDRANIRLQRIRVGGEVRTFRATLRSPEELTDLALTDPLLIDNRVVCHRYCQVKKPGWEFLRCIDGRIWRQVRHTEMLRKALAEDCPETFRMALDLTGEKLSFSLLAEILKVIPKHHIGEFFDRRGAQRIFASLLQERQMLEKVIPLDELCCFITAQFCDEDAVERLELIEQSHPGTLKNCRDFFGRNLLWYVVHSSLTGWFHPDCTLTPYLLKKGCDPDNVNTAGLSWRRLTEGLTPEQKQQQMLRRYGSSQYSCDWGWILRKKQPLWNVYSSNI